MPESFGLSDEFIRRLVLSQPIPDRLIRRLAAVPPDFVVRVEFGRAGPSMTPALRYTLILVSLGWTNRQIADELSLGVEAVKARIKRLLAYYRARNRTDLVAKAIRAGDI